MHIPLSGRKIQEIDFRQLAANKDAPLHMVKSLDLSNNEIKSVRGLTPFVSMTHLDLSHNRINLVDGLPTSLVALNLSHNSMKIASGMQALKSLEELSLSSNQLSSIGDLCHNSALRVLKLGNNRLQVLAGIESLRNLESLELHNNHIERPEELRVLSVLPNLRHLTLEGNPLCRSGTHRSLIAQMVPSLEVLDGQPISSIVDAAQLETSVASTRPQQSQQQPSPMRGIPFQTTSVTSTTTMPPQPVVGQEPLPPLHPPQHLSQSLMSQLGASGRMPQSSVVEDGQPHPNEQQQQQQHGFQQQPARPPSRVEVPGSTRRPLFQEAPPLPLDVHGLFEENRFLADENSRLRSLVDEHTQRYESLTLELRAERTRNDALQANLSAANAQAHRMRKAAHKYRHTARVLEETLLQMRTGGVGIGAVGADPSTRLTATREQTLTAIGDGMLSTSAERNYFDEMLERGTEPNPLIQQQQHGGNVVADSVSPLARSTRRDSKARSEDRAMPTITEEQQQAAFTASSLAPQHRQAQDTLVEASLLLAAEYLRKSISQPAMGGGTLSASQGLPRDPAWESESACVPPTEPYLVRSGRMLQEPDEQMVMRRSRSQPPLSMMMMSRVGGVGEGEGDTQTRAADSDKQDHLKFAVQLKKYLMWTDNRSKALENRKHQHADELPPVPDLFASSSAPFAQQPLQSAMTAPHDHQESPDFTTPFSAPQQSFQPEPQLNATQNQLPPPSSQADAPLFVPLMRSGPMNLMTDVPPLPEPQSERERQVKQEFRARLEEERKRLGLPS